MNFLQNFFASFSGVSFSYDFSVYYLLPFIIIIPTIIFIFIIFNNKEANYQDDTPRKKKILIVDDSVVVRVKLQKLLSQIYDTAEAQNGLEALKFLDSENRVDLIITDLEMPEMDGFELIAYVTGSLETEHIPIVAITSHDSLSAKVNQLGGVYGIFNKPWNDRELLKRIGSLVQIKK